MATMVAPKRKLRAGDFVSIKPHHVMTHDNTSAVLKKFKAIGATKVKYPRQPVFALPVAHRFGRALAAIV